MENHQEKHRKIVLRHNTKVYDTGFTTGSSSEISDDDSLKRRLSDLVEDSRANKKIKTTPRRESGDIGSLTSSPSLHIDESTPEKIANPIESSTPEPVVSPIRPRIPEEETLEIVISPAKVTRLEPVVSPIQETLEPVVSPVQEVSFPVLSPVQETMEPVVSRVQETSVPVISPIRPSTLELEPVAIPVQPTKPDELEVLEPEPFVWHNGPRTPPTPEESDALQSKSTEPITSAQANVDGILPNYPSPVVSLYEFESPESEPEQEVHVVSASKREQGKRLAEYTKKLRASGGMKKPVRKSKRAGLILPVDRILKKMKAFFPNYRVQTNSAVFLTGVIEYLVAELLEISGSRTLESNRKRINPRDIKLAVNDDLEFDKLFKDVNIMQGGVVPSIRPELIEPLKKKKTPGYKRAESMQEVSGQAEKSLGTTIEATTAENYSGKKPTRTKAELHKLRQEQGKWLAEHMRKKRESAKEAKLWSEITNSEADKPSSQIASQTTQGSFDDSFHPPTPSNTDQSESSENETDTEEDEHEQKEHITRQFGTDITKQFINQNNSSLPDPIKKNSLKRTFSY